MSLIIINSLHLSIAIFSLYQTVWCNIIEDFTNETSGRRYSVEFIFKHLVRDNPTIILLDNDESDLEFSLRKALLSVDNAGTVIYTFNPWWRFAFRGLELKPKIGAVKTTPFRWTFICLIEEKRNRIRAERYLQELLAIGHGREDRFFLVGQSNHLSAFMKSRPVDKFKNIMALATEGNVIYQRKFQKQNVLESRFGRFTDLESVFWYTGKTKSLNGQHFRISGTKFPPYLDIVYDNGGKKLMGVNYQIFNQGSRHFNYTYEFNDESDWKLTGKKYTNGTWDGVYGDLLNGKADIASVSTQTVDRAGLADFVGPFGRAHLIFVSSPPETYLGKYALFRSYSIEVWGLILTFYMTFVYLYDKALIFSQMRGWGKQKSGNILVRAFMTIWSLSFEQTLEKRPRGTRFLMILWVIFIMIIGTGYRSNMAAFISFPMPESKPKSFEQLNEATNYVIYFDLSGVSAYTYFERSNNSLIKNLEKRAKPERNTTACVVNAFMDRRTVCIGWDFTLKLAASMNMTIPQLDTPLYSSTESVWAAWYTFALAKNSIFTDAFQYIGQTSFETGLTAFWRNRILNQYRKYSMQWNKTADLQEKLAKLRGKSKSETKPLKVENFQFMFLILLGGIFISCLGFLFEIFKGKESCRRKKHFYKQASNLHIIYVEQKSIPIDFVR